MYRIVVALALLLSGGILPRGGTAQFLYMDASGDGANDASDRLGSAGTTAVDIWIETDTNRDGSRADSRVAGRRPLTINQYELILRAVGGEVDWGEYRNLQPTMTTTIKPKTSATDYYVFYGGLTPLPPGKYKLGTLRVKATSGNPKLMFGSSTPLWACARTSFGSQREGKDGDNTLKFTEDPSNLGSPSQDVPGDWSDASGLAAPTASARLGAAMESRAPASFSVSLSPNPANPDATLEVRTTRAGFIRVRIFDLSGRLVRTAMAETSAPAGTYTVRLPGMRSGRPMPSGVYLYRVETTERTVEGKLLIVK